MACIGCDHVEPLDLDTDMDDCQMTSRTLDIAGTVDYDTFQAGDIELYIDEEFSERCGDTVDSRLIVHPGNRIGAITLAGPGAFETMVTVSYIEGELPPEISVMAVHKPAAVDGQRCEAGQLIFVEPEDIEGLTIRLDPGYCPVLR